jgi:hypothetical protein
MQFEGCNGQENDSNPGWYDTSAPGLEEGVDLRIAGIGGVVPDKNRLSLRKASRTAGNV